MSENTNKLENNKKEVQKISTKVTNAIPRLLNLAPNSKSLEFLSKRIPLEGQTNANGFDAGIACALDLIPGEISLKGNKQKLSAMLHGGYSNEAVQQVIQESKNMESNSETCWWLVACSCAKEGGVDQQMFLEQIEDFRQLTRNPESMKKAAMEMFTKMKNSFRMDEPGFEGIPFGTEDGSIQGAYVSGHKFGVTYSKTHDAYFIGTYEPTLGLEDMNWPEGSKAISKQFLLFKNDEVGKKALNEALAGIKSRLSQ